MYAHAMPKSGHVDAGQTKAADIARQHAGTPTAQTKLEGTLNDSVRVQSQLHMSDALNQSPRAAVQAKLVQLMSSPAPYGRISDGQGLSDEDELIQSKSAVQRQDLEDDELLQKMPVQREETDEDELAQMQSTTAQREDVDEDELAQMKSTTVQREETDEDELVQMQSTTAQREDVDEDELAQMKSITAQREDMDEDELAQMKSMTAQRQDMPDEEELQQQMPVQRRANTTGMPDQLKSGIEGLSGLSMDGVQVHYNSSKPASLQAHAYTQGSDIHVAPGQERHLAHEAWHVVQQAQGRVQPTMQLRGTAVNDDPDLETEADVMGAKALQRASIEQSTRRQSTGRAAINSEVYQRVSSGAVAQLIYLWDRTKQKKPVWSDGQPPSHYLPSGEYDDKGTHGPDELYARLDETDLFYGISYEEGEDADKMQEFLTMLEKIGQQKKLNLETPEGYVAAVQIFESEFGKPPLDVASMGALFGGSSGWERYPSYLPEKRNAAISVDLQKRNPGLPWAKDPAGVACQVTMLEALKRDGSVRFLLDGMMDVKGILEETSEWSNNITSRELRFAVALLGQTVKTGEDTQVVPKDGVNVFFYLNRRLVPVEWLSLGQMELAQAMARKLAEEEEWDEEDEAEGLYDLMQALANGLSGEQLLEALTLP